ncbi:hypothetical protein XAR_4105 [Xanthomonas citri pv. glycines str. 8ra]|nr:hypothetical protein XAR_4105 [Xanthomonas citri pv. glycines str. 8ra]
MIAHAREDAKHARVRAASGDRPMASTGLTQRRLPRSSLRAWAAYGVGSASAQRDRCRPSAPGESANHRMASHAQRHAVSQRPTGAPAARAGATGYRGAPQGAMGLPVTLHRARVRSYERAGSGIQRRRAHPCRRLKIGTPQR